MRRLAERQSLAQMPGHCWASSAARIHRVCDRQAPLLATPSIARSVSAEKEPHCPRAAARPKIPFPLRVYQPPILRLGDCLPPQCAGHESAKSCRACCCSTAVGGGHIGRRVVAGFLRVHAQHQPLSPAQPGRRCNRRWRRRHSTSSRSCCRTQPLCPNGSRSTCHSSTPLAILPLPFVTRLEAAAHVDAGAVPVPCLGALENRPLVLAYQAVAQARRAPRPRCSSGAASPWRAPRQDAAPQLRLLLCPIDSF